MAEVGEQALAAQAQRVRPTGPSEPPPGTESAARFGVRSARDAVRWSAAAVAGRQLLQLAFGVLLARLLGPGQYSLVGLATLFVTLSTLLLDQGLSSALVQRQQLSKAQPGAAVSLNLISGAVLAAGAWVLAPLLADFFHRPTLLGVIRLLGLGLVLKSLSITPRAMLSRGLRFRALALADLLGATLGAASGTVAVLLGAEYYAVVAQVVATDLVVVVLLLRSAGGPWPNVALWELRPLVAFGVRIFATNGLAFFSRNTDNILVGRYLGAPSLGLYAMAYRVLVIPVQLLGQTVTRVLFPVFSRIADDRQRLGRAVLAGMELLAMVAVPSMALAACSAPQFVVLGLGRQWAEAAPLISVLALAGARESIFYITPALMTASGRADLNLRYEIGATFVQVAGIVLGLRSGVLGVAVGYAVAGLVITPVLLRLQSHLTGIALRQQLATVWPAVHASLWASAAYLLVAAQGWSDLRTVLGGVPVYAVVLAGVLFMVHPGSIRRVISRARARTTPTGRPQARQA